MHLDNLLDYQAIIRVLYQRRAPEHELAPRWDAMAAGGSLTHYATMLVPKNKS